MQAHFVHSNNEGQLAVLGVFLKKGKHNPFIQTLWDEMPTEIEARVGLVNLEKYDKIIKRRTKNAKKYFDYFKDSSSIQLPVEDRDATFSHFVALVDNRNTWLEEYFQKGIQLGWLIEYSIPYMRAYHKYRCHDCPVSLEYSYKAINLPLHHDITYES